MRQPGRDLEKAFDSVDLIRLVGEAVREALPPQLAQLSIASYAHPRRLHVGRDVGPTVQPTRGVVAGSAAATTELACALAAPFKAAPAAIVTVHVDDSPAAFVAPSRVAVRTVVRNGRTLTAEL